MDRIEELIQFIEREDPNQWSDEWLEAVHKLAEIKDQRVVTSLCKFLRVKDNRWFATAKRSHAIHALGRIRDPKCIQPLCDVLDDTKHDSLLNSDTMLLNEIIRILSSFGDAAVVPLCQKLKSGKSTTARSMAAFGLASLRNSATVPILKSRLKPIFGERDRGVLDAIQSAIASIEKG